MNIRRRVILGAVAAAFAGSASGQIPTRTARIGMLFFGAPPAGGNAAEPIVRQLTELGWVEGRNVEYAMRYAGGKREAFPALAAELSALPLDVIFSVGSDVARTFRPIASSTPVVFAASDDPVATGIVSSLARPGGRFTGVSFMSPQLAAKRLELLKEMLPAVRRVAVLTDPGHEAYLPEFVRAAETMNVALTTIRFETAAEFAAAFASAKAAGADALFVVPSRYTLAYGRQLAELSIKHRLPAISAYDAFARAGGLLAYGPTSQEMIVRAASFIDRILRGAKAGDLPVEQASGVALLVNATTAKALGLTIPPSILVRADEIIR